MTDDQHQPAGWYRTPDGNRRYWDGGAWTDHIVEPDAPAAATTLAPAPAPATKANQAKKILIPIGACVALLVIFGIIGAVATQSDDEKTAEAPTTAGTDGAPATSTEVSSTEAATTTDAPTTTTIPPAQLEAEVDAAWRQACAAAGQSGLVPPIDYNSNWAQIGVDASGVHSLAQNCANDARSAAIDGAAPVSADAVVRDPNSVKGQFFVLVADIAQFDAATGPCTFRGAWGNQPHEYSFEYDGDNAVFSAPQPCPVLDGIDQNDVVRLWVEGAGSLTYDTQIGGSTTVPSFTVLRAEIITKE